MKRKANLIFSIAVTLLTLAIFGFGVYAAINEPISISNEIIFKLPPSAEGDFVDEQGNPANITISATVEGCVKDKGKSYSYTASASKASFVFPAWDLGNLSFIFNEGQTTLPKIVFNFTFKNDVYNKSFYCKLSNDGANFDSTNLTRMFVYEDSALEQTATVMNGNEVSFSVKVMPKKIDKFFIASNNNFVVNIFAF
ncbi:MAG: hypothetical protein RR140_00280 [Clostridia bacterium]